MNDNATLITRFYTAFQQRDAATMAACYHADIVFNDPVFVNLRGSEAGAMWKMLCERGKDLVITFSDVQADDTTGRAHWEATYTFSKSGRKVHNIIEARFKFQDGLIIEHHDSFSFRRWSAHALGLPGQLMGWTPFLHKKVQQESRLTLEKFMARSSA